MTSQANEIASLRARVDDAMIDLDALAPADPSAECARHALRLTRYTLERFWLPTLDGLADDAT